jgi:hypothetical protein
LAATYDDEEVDSGFDNEIYTDSNVTFGTWSFDLYWGGETYHGPAFWFAMDDVDDELEFFPGGYGLCLQLNKDPDEPVDCKWQIIYIDPTHEYGGYVLTTWDSLYGVNAWRHVHFTVEDNSPFGSMFRLWVNGTSVGGCNIEETFESEYFFVSLNYGCEVDNFMVKDTVEDPPDPTTTTSTTTTTSNPTPTTTPTPTPTDTGIPTELLAVGIGVPVILVIVVVVWKVKK